MRKPNIAVMNPKQTTIPEHMQRRLELSGLFYPLERKYERRWGKTFASGWPAIIMKLEALADEMGYRQETVAPYAVVWYDQEKQDPECMFCMVDQPNEFEQVAHIFTHIRKLHPFFTYGIVHQAKDGEGTYDIFRFSRFSYLEHCNRIRAPKYRKKPA
jgi:hypothetical protein